MSKVHSIAKTAVMVVLWLIVIWAVIVLLTGCLQLTRNERLDEGNFRVEADCDKNTVEVELDLDRTDDRKDATVTK